MKNFWKTETQHMTIGQATIWIVLYFIFIMVVMAAMMVVPQHAEEIWDTIEAWVDKIKEKFLKKRSFEEKCFN